MRTLSMVCFAIAVAFVGIGITGQKTFLWIGIAWLALFLFRFLRCAIAKQ